MGLAETLKTPDLSALTVLWEPSHVTANTTLSPSLAGGSQWPQVAAREITSCMAVTGVHRTRRLRREHQILAGLSLMVMTTKVIAGASGGCIGGRSPR